MDLQELTQQLRDYYKDTEMISDLDDFNEHDEQGIDLYINNAEMLEWSEDLYNQWIDFIQNYKLDGEGYGLVFNTDGSGYNYWIKNQEETPHLSLVIEIDDLSKINTDKLLADINTALQQYDDEETRLWQIANEKNEDITTLTDKIDKADNDLEELLRDLNKSIHEALDEKVLIIEWCFNNPDNWSEADVIESELIITKHSNGTFSWKETYDDNHAEGFATAGEAYENAVENESNVDGAFGLSDYDGFQIDKDYDEVVEYFKE